MANPKKPRSDQEARDPQTIPMDSERLQSIRNRTYPFHLARRLRTEEEREAFLEVILGDGDPQEIARAQKTVARSRFLLLHYTYEILPRPVELGGGWKLRLLERGEEVGGGVFPPKDATKEALDEAYQDAEIVAEDWLVSRPNEDGTLED